MLSHSSYMATHRVQKSGFISILTFNISLNCFIEKDENQLQFLFAGNIKLKYFAKKYFICIIKTLWLAPVLRSRCGETARVVV